MRLSILRLQKDFQKPALWPGHNRQFQLVLQSWFSSFQGFGCVSLTKKQKLAVWFFHNVAMAAMSNVYKHEQWILLHKHVRAAAKSIQFL